MNKILIIEDDRTIIEGLVNAFTFNGFEVRAVGSSEEGVVVFQQAKPDLVILDIMLPGADGFEMCKRIRSFDLRTPIIMLTAKSQESDKLLSFELGADDYVTKPFSAKELIARVKAVLKRSVKNVPEPEVERWQVVVGSSTINFRDFTIIRGGVEYPLSPKEQHILKLLVRHPDTVISRSKIIDEVWGDEYFPSPKTIDNFVVKLRGKIEENPRQPRHILTVHGAGYKFKY